MAIVPSKDLEAVQFFETHWPVWGAAPTVIGLTAAQVTVMEDRTKSARDAYTAQQAAKEAAKAATTTYRSAVSSMRSVGSDLISTIKAFAETTNNPNVYANAQIPPPAPPTPAPAPGQPNNFRALLTGTGAVEVSWKATNSAASGGVYFTVHRKLASESVYTLIGNVGAKKYVDSTIPQGSGGATYIVQGFRGLDAGLPSDGFAIQFGVGGNGVAGNTLKIAA